MKTSPLESHRDQIPPEKMITSFLNNVRRSSFRFIAPRGGSLLQNRFQIRPPLLAKMFTALLLLATSQAKALPPGNWTIIYNEDFNGTSLNTAIWSTGYRWKEVINNELQAMRPENVTVANGVCTIKAEKRTAINRDMWGRETTTKNYASGAITTYNKWTQTYGYFEARIKMPTSKGTWPAFWLLPDRGAAYDDYYRNAVGNSAWYPPSGPSVACPMGNEIDIVEYMGTWKNPTTGLSKYHVNQHWGYPGSAGGYRKVNQLVSPDTTFHTYGVYWGPNQVAFYVDDEMVKSNSTNVGVCPHYMLLNCALTTNDWTGTAVPLADIDATLPGYMQIDYVRVYSGTPFVSGPTAVNDNSAAIAYTGAWTYATSATGNINNDQHYTNVTGNSAQLTFQGPEIHWIGRRHPNRGEANVYIDGAFAAVVDLYSASLNEYQQVLFSRNDLSNAVHSIKVEVKGTKNPSSSDYYIIVDTFDFARAMRIVNDDSASVIYGGTWIDFNPASGRINNDSHYTDVTGNYAQMTFTGTEVQWIGKRYPNRGHANVYIDNAFAATVDLYSSSTNENQQVIFSRNNLTNASHTIKVVAKGTKHASSTGYHIEVDAFKTK